MKNAVGKIAGAIRRYAAEQQWSQDDFKIFVEVNSDWGRIHAIFVARQFPGQYPEDQWLSVINSLELSLKNEPELLDSMNLTLRTFDEVDQGGLYSLSPEYVDVDELIANQYVV